MSASYVRHELPLWERELLGRQYMEEVSGEEAEDPEDYTRPPKELMRLG